MATKEGAHEPQAEAEGSMNLGTETSGFDSGAYGILPTPFDDEDRVDLEGVGHVARFYEEKGARGVVALAVMGEGIRLDEGERAEVIRQVVTAVHVPVTVGVSAPSFHLVRKRTEEAMALGASSVLLAPHAGMDEAAIFELFTDAASVGAPVVLQDHPASTGVTMSPTLIARIVDGAEGIVAVKNEAPPTPTRTRRIVDAMGGRKIPVFGGLGALRLLDELDEGAKGTMTGFAFPEVLAAIVAAQGSGDRGRARDLYQAFLPWIVFEATPSFGLRIRKEFLRLRGVIARAAARRPSPDLDEAQSHRARELFLAFDALWRLHGPVPKAAS